MRKYLLLIIVVFLAGCKTSSDMVSSAGYFDTGGKTTYQDKDWNLEFYDNCGFPESSSVRWVTEGKETFLRFTLKNKQIGECSTDATRDPYRERAEIKQSSTLIKDADYTLTFRVRFVKGFTFHNESFLQIHQGVAGCRVPPLLKLEFIRKRFRWNPLLQIEQITGKWIDVKLNFNTSKWYDLYFDDKKIVDTGGYWRQAPCGEPHFKFGIYRPGDEGASGERISIVDFDKINLVEMKK